MLYVAILISIGVIAGGVFHLKKSLTSSIGAERETLLSELASIEEELGHLAKFEQSYAAKGQFDTLIQMVDEAKGNLESAKANLVSIEGKLDSCQKSVEEKEAQQQELKSAKEEDERAVQELLGEFNAMSDEALALEQRLANSLKNLDTMISELELTADQKQVLEDLSEQVTQASSLFRELVTEYNDMHERLEMLQTQHVDLEDEYTKLVEQQLGE